MDVPNLLFIHRTYPGQFSYLAPILTSRLRARTIFLTLSEHNTDLKWPNVESRRFSRHRDVSEGIHPYLERVELAVLNGQAVVRQLFALQAEGFVPDLVIAINGYGFSSYIKNIYPNCKVITYAEWYFSDSHQLELNSKIEVNELMRINALNLPIQDEILSADVCICPTRWQAQQFPPEFQEKITCIFDGVVPAEFPDGFLRESFDIQGDAMASPLTIKSGDLLLTYGTRGMEPLRGFPEFMRAAAVAQKVFKHLKVIVYGDDRVAYGMTSEECSHLSGSWRSQMLEELNGKLDLDRLYFTGLLDYQTLSKLFRRTNLHCYFTRPYIVSWAVFQASASGTPLLMNSFPGVEEVLGGASEFPLVDIESQESVNGGVLSALRQVSIPNFTRSSQSRLAEGKDFESCMNLWIDLIQRQLGM